jgi:tetratricopeptide (TPR) repeat protein
MNEKQPEGGSAQPPDSAGIRAEIERRVRQANDAIAAGKWGDAGKIYAALSRAFPASAAFHANLGVCLRQTGKPAAALASLRRAQTLAPNDAGTSSALGSALRDLGRIDEALVAHERAIKLDPKQRAVRFHLALALRDARRGADALKLLKGLTADFPDDAAYQWELALTQLRMGDLREGFRNYEARWRFPRNGLKLYEGRQWTGESVVGKTVFLQSEDGHSDAIQAVRYVPRLAQRGARVILECAPELRRLFETVEGVAGTVVKGEQPPAADFHAPLLSLPRLFGAALNDLEAKVPYLRAPAPFALPSLAARAGVRIGLVWGGQAGQRDASWPLRSLMPLLNDPRIAFVSLQKGPHTAELAQAGYDHVIYDLGQKLNDFADVAGAIEQCQLIIAVDGPAAHLAGALGKPVWLLLRHVSDWRWMDERTDSPWYPTMHLLRQTHAEDFEGSVEQIRAQLAGILAKAPQNQPAP